MIRKLLAMVLLLAPISAWAADAPGPNPNLTPGEVVEIQVEALRTNDKPARDAGIAITFSLASPGNRRVTGPLEHFAQIVKSPAYKPMIGHRIAGYGPVLIRGDRAIRRVTIIAADGKAYEYEFQLSKDPESGCWFTDGAIPVPDLAPVEPGNIA
ncbi:DUF4864 domain-containing protein [Tundrisphaera lichenicola]|uniref:DUF4864 domain-containing protein n=1 Tax=Tundrisphaera lichenicola TaxID=2029860 RepID=UPI003EBD8988